MRHFFIAGHFFGSGPANPYQFRDELARRPWATAYFCPVCGEIWARIAIEGEEFHIYTTRCEKHEAQWEFSVPGSLWIDFDKNLTDSFPPEVLKREFELHLAHGEKFYGKETVL